MKLSSQIFLGFVILLCNCGTEVNENVEEAKDTREKEFFEDGALKSTGQYGEGKKKEGLWVSYYEGGKIQDSTNYQNDEPNGSSTAYHENGRRLSAGKFVNGKAVGEWLFWNEEGRLQEKSNWSNGKPNGLGQTFYEKNKIQSEVNWTEGIMNGEWKSYYENGTVSEITYYENGLKDGMAESFYPNGKLKAQMKYELEVPSGFFIEFYENGLESSRVEYVNGKMEGNRFFYDSLGRVTKTEIYVGGILEESNQ